MSDKIIKPLATSNNSPVLELRYIDIKIKGKSEGQGLKQNKVTFIYGKTVTICIVYEINFWDHGYDDYPTLANSLFGAVKLVKNPGIDKYKYHGCGIWFDRRGAF